VELAAMKVTVKLIAIYRKLLPEGIQGNTLAVDVAEGTQVEDLLRDLGVPLDHSSVILVNGHVPDNGQKLSEGDVVHAFPAMAGG
jgi:sulfur carrier protein ThiS